MDFRKLISPQERAEIARENEMLIAFQEMDAAGMASEILEKARLIQDSGYLSTDQRYSYDEWAVYRILPEMALRLDPSVVLLDRETPKPEEKGDPVTWVKTPDQESFKRMITSALENVSLARVSRGTPPPDQGVRDAVELLFRQGRCNAVSIAADTLYPGFRSARTEPDTRDPLPGYQIIAIREGKRDLVLTYCETLEKAEGTLGDGLDVLSGKRDAEGIAFRFSRLFEERQYVESLTIQDWHGQILKTATPEADCADCTP